MSMTNRNKSYIYYIMIIQQLLSGGEGPRVNMELDTG